MAAVTVPRPIRRDAEVEPSTYSSAPAWRPLADALMSANNEDTINLNAWSYESSSTDADVEITVTSVSETTVEYAESEAEELPEELELDDDPDNIYDALTCDYDIPLTSGTATPSPCATPIRTPRTPREHPLDHAQIASAAIAHKLASRVEAEEPESYAIERLRACCVSCVHGLQALTNALLGDESKAEQIDEMIKVAQRPGSSIHFLIPKRMVEPESDEDYELGEDEFGFDDFE